MPVDYQDPIEVLQEQQYQQRAALERKQQEAIQEALSKLEEKKLARHDAFQALYSTISKYDEDYDDLDDAQHVEELNYLEEQLTDLINSYRISRKRRPNGVTGQKSATEIGSEGGVWKLYGIERNSRGWRFITTKHWYRLTIQDESIIKDSWQIKEGDRLAFDEEIYARVGLDGNRAIFVEFVDNIEDVTVDTIEEDIDEAVDEVIKEVN